MQAGATRADKRLLTFTLETEVRFAQTKPTCTPSPKS
jgi:hypothetical protein